MNLLKLGLTISLLIMSNFVTAQTEAEVEAEKLLSVMGMEQAMNESMSNMVDLQIQQNPMLAPFKPVMMKFFEKHMSWESLKFEFTYIYAQAFTASELKELNAFYATKVGQKTIEKMPELMAKGAQIGMARVQENMPELQSMIKEESERLQKLAEQE